MNTAPADSLKRNPSIFRNWVSMAGAVLMAASAFAFVLLFFMDAFAHVSNPYVGILTYLVSPAFFLGGLVLFLLGAWWRRRKLAKGNGTNGSLHIDIDLSRLRDRRILSVFIPASAGFFLITAMGTYHTYQFTESVQFCGESCHKVMGPELTTYLHSPHARVACAECHVGHGAEWYLKSKVSGTHQLFAVIRNNYPRPIPPPNKGLRPAQDTCEQCHWPNKYVGNLDRTYNYFLPDETNSLYSIRLSLKVGGGDPTHGPVGGIHWHMNVGNKIEYIATDEARQKIPWVRMTDKNGKVTEFKTASFTNDGPKLAVRRMDCMDCHNRPAHKFITPETSVNLAMADGRIDTGLAFIKTNAVGALCKVYKDNDEAMQQIAATL